MLDIEGDDPTWWNGVQRNASGAVPEGKLTFLDINKRLCLLDNDSGFGKRLSKGGDLRYAGVSRGDAGSEIDDWTSDTKE